MSKPVIECYAFIIYPSVDNKLFDLGWLLNFCPVVLSPIHNRDKFKDGTFKKPHYHCIFIGKPTSILKRALYDRFGVCHYEPVKDKIAYFHYLYHWDNSKQWYLPDKACYWKGDIKYGFNVNESIFRFGYDNNDYFRLCLTIINDNSFFEWFLFIDFIVDLRDQDLLTYVRSNSNLIKSYIDSKRFSQKRFCHKY